MPRTPDFFAHLDVAELNSLEAFAREPKHGIRHCCEWIEAKGIVTSRSAVGRWFKRFRETDRLSEAAELADAIHSASADAGAVDVAGAVNLQLAQRLQAALVKGGDKLAMGDLLKGAMAVNALTNAQGKIEDLKRTGREQLDRLKGEAAAGRMITPDMIAAASKAVFG
jgi:hypothetical protein